MRYESKTIRRRAITALAIVVAYFLGTSIGISQTNESSAEAAGPTLLTEISYARNPNPTLPTDFCAGETYDDPDCLSRDSYEDILQYGPALDEFLVEITLTLANAPTGWAFCESSPDEFIDARRNFMKLNDLGISPIYSERYFADFWAKGFYPLGEAFGLERTTYGLSYQGYALEGNKNKLTFEPKMYICGPKTPGSDVMTWQLVTGKKTTTPTFNKWPLS